MKKFIFTKSFSTPIGIGGAVGKSTYSKKKGDVVEGVVVFPKSDINKGIAGVPPVVQVRLVPKGAFLLQGQAEFLEIPLSYLKEQTATSEETKTDEVKTDEVKTEKSIPIGKQQQEVKSDSNTKTTSKLFTTKNILIGLVGIAVVYGVLKATKIIK